MTTLLSVQREGRTGPLLWTRTIKLSWDSKFLITFAHENPEFKAILYFTLKQNEECVLILYHYSTSYMKLHQKEFRGTFLSLEGWTSLSCKSSCTLLYIQGISNSEWWRENADSTPPFSSWKGDHLCRSFLPFCSASFIARLGEHSRCFH